MASDTTVNRLEIRAYKTPECSEPPVDTMKAYVNPGELTLAYEIEYDSGQGAGTTHSRMDFKRIKPGDFTLNLFLDGTGANGRPADVQSLVAKFQKVTGYNGEIHRPNYLKIGWGNIDIRRCVLKSASIAYKLFKPDGTPLRAIITAAFTDYLDDQTREALSKNTSADLTHMRIVMGGDTLPGLCQAIYGSPRRYLDVARANDLDSIRDLPPGRRLVFPPLEK